MQYVEDYRPEVELFGLNTKKSVNFSNSPSVNLGNNVSLGSIYSPATLVVAPVSSGYKADYYTDGANDEVQINQAIVAAAAIKGSILLKSGIYTINATIVPLSNAKIQGEGLSTVLSGSGNGFSIIQNLATLGSPLSNIEICDLKIDGSNVTSTAGYTPLVKGIYIQYINRLLIHGVYVYNTYATGIGADFLVDSVIDRCVVDSCGVNGAATGQAGTGANGIGVGTGAYATESWVVSNCIAKNTGNNGIMMEDQFHTTRSANMTVNSCVAYGGKVGFMDSGTSQVSFNNCWAANNTGEGFKTITGDIGTVSQNFNPQNISFTSCYAFNNGIGNTLDGFFITDNKNDGTLTGVTMTNCVSAGNTEHGFNINKVKNVSMVNCVSHDNNAHGMLCFSNNSGAPNNNINILGGLYYNNGKTTTGDGIRIGGSGSGTMDNCTVQGVTCFDNQGTKTQRYGLSVTGTVTNTQLLNSNVLNNNTGTVLLATAYSSLIIRNIVGYNPVGQSAITVTASPFTYTNGNSPADVFINGGTVSAIVKGSTTLASASPAVVHLEPNQSVVVTYSSIPTMATDVY